MSLKKTSLKILTPASIFFIVLVGCSPVYVSKQLAKNNSPVKTPRVAAPVPRGVCFSRLQAIQIRKKIILLKLNLTHCQKKTKTLVNIQKVDFHRKIKICRLRNKECLAQVKKMLSTQKRMWWKTVITTAAGLGTGFLIGYLAIKLGN